MMIKNAEMAHII